MKKKYPVFPYQNCSQYSNASIVEEYEMKKEKNILEKHFNEIHFPLGSQ